MCSPGPRTEGFPSEGAVTLRETAWIPHSLGADPPGCPLLVTQWAGILATQPKTTWRMRLTCGSGGVLKADSMNQRDLEVTSPSIVGGHEEEAPRPLTHIRHLSWIRYTTVSILDRGLAQGQCHINLSFCQAPVGTMELMDVWGCWNLLG